MMEEVKLYHCGKCSMIFESMHELMTHYEAEHFGRTTRI